MDNKQINAIIDYVLTNEDRLQAMLLLDALADVQSACSVGSYQAYRCMWLADYPLAMAIMEDA
jgi:hypothetical protein